MFSLAVHLNVNIQSWIQWAPSGLEIFESSESFDCKTVKFLSYYGLEDELPNRVS